MPRKPLLQALMLILLGAAGAGAVTPRLVEDLHPEAGNGGSEPRLFLTLDNGISFFQADDGEHGRQLWRSDGTAAGTYRLTDATCPSFCDTDPNFGFKVVGNRLFFVIWDEAYNPTLWVTGGSAQDTFPLGEAGAILGNAVWIESRGLLFFRAMDPEHGESLWRTDGTPAGTSKVAPMRPLEMIEHKGRLLFSAADHRGASLWSTDGTLAGTRLLRDPLPAQDVHAAPVHLRVVGQRLLFFAPHPTLRYALWRSDGTRSGTAPVVRVDGAFLISEGSAERPVEVAAGRLWFVLEEIDRSQQLWTSDGTPGGTRQLTRLPGDYGTIAVPRVALGGRVLFRADDTVHGNEPWVSDGTLAGTRLLRDVCPGDCSSSPNPVSTLGNRFFFAANDGSRGFEPWLSDGTPAGTRLLRDLCRGSCPSLPQVPRMLGGRAILAAVDAQGRYQLWRTNGTANGTIRLTTLPRGIGELATRPTSGAFLFRAWDAEHGDELWSTDGTRPGTRLVADINTVGGSFPRELTPLGQEAAFVADRPDLAGTVQSEGEFSSPGELTVAGPRLFFRATDPIHGMELWALE